jgi:hypothetical protein
MTDIIRLGVEFDAGRRGRLLPSPQRFRPPRERAGSGLPPTYVVQQLKDFKNGLRRSAILESRTPIR